MVAPACTCTRQAAWDWVLALAEDALNGDRFAQRLLPRIIDHALYIERIQG